MFKELPKLDLKRCTEKICSQISLFSMYVQYLRFSSIQPHIRPVHPSISMRAKFKVRYVAESTWVSDLSPTPELCKTLLKTNIDATNHPSRLPAITGKIHNLIHHHYRVCLPPKYHPSSCARSCFSACQKSYRCHRSL
jgi:hypothetical protein